MKKIIKTMVVVLTIASTVQATAQKIDDFGRSELMNYIIKQEEELKIVSDELDYVSSKITALSSLTDPSKYKDAIKPLKSHKYEAANNREILELKAQQARLSGKYTTTLKETQEKIFKMATDTIDWTQKDFAGNTLLDHCKTKEIYDVLRELGVPFQLGRWVHFNKQYIVLTTWVGAAALAASFIGSKNESTQETA